MRVRNFALTVALGLAATACVSDDPITAAPNGSNGADSDASVAAVGAPDRPIELGDPNAIQPLDPASLIVDAESIVFDTFDGGSVTLAEADQETIDRLLDAIAPIDAPEYEPGAEADWLASEDVVIGYVDEADNAWAFPVRMLNFHEIVNDQFAGVPVLVSYCPLCGSGVVFDRRLDGQTISFSNTSALHENDMVMVDRETGSYWWQVPGRAVGGEFAGQELEVLPAQTIGWADWLEAHPDTQLLSQLPGRNYARDPFVGYADRVDAGQTPFPVSDEALADGRLSAGTSVVVATIDGETRAWPVSPERQVEDRVGDTDVTVTLDGEVGGTVVRTDDGTPVGTRTSLWFAVVASFPEVTVGS